MAFLIMMMAALSAAGSSDAQDAASQGTDGNIDWSISGDTLTLSKNSEKEEGTMEDYSKYTRPAWEEGEGWSGVSKVEISAGVTSIGNNAFRSCTGIASVSIPDTVTKIGQEAFYGCTGLGSVTVPDSVTDLFYSVFEGCTSLTSAVIGNSVDNLRSSLFLGCTSLSAVTVGSGVKIIGDLVFKGCASLTSVSLPAGITSVGVRVFEGCTKLASIEVGESQVGIYSSLDGVLMLADHSTHLPTIIVAYPNAKGVSYDVPIGVMTIGEYSFSCTSIENITFSTSVISINSQAFRYCTSLKGVDLGGNISAIAGMAFLGCTALEHATVGGKVKLIGEEAFSGCTSLSTVTIEDSVTAMREYAFQGCTKIRSMTVSSALETVGQNSFEGITFYLDGQQVEPIAEVLAGRTWTGEGNGKLYSLSEGYTVTFDANGGSCDTPSMKTGTDGKLASLPDAVRDRYTFDGWYTQAEGGEKITTSYVFTADTTVYAHWTESPVKFMVTFDANGGSCDTPSMKTGTDGKLSSLPDASRDKYTFDGWYTQAEGGEKITTSYVFTADTTVYAHWTSAAGGNSGLMIALAVLGVAGIAMAGAALFMMRRS